MITITPEAAAQLRGLDVDGSPAKLEFNAEPDNDGGYNCSVALVGKVGSDAEIEEVDGITVAFRGVANSVFEGSVVGLNAEGELSLEMAEEDGCDSCGEEGCGPGCSCGGH